MTAAWHSAEAIARALEWELTSGTMHHLEAAGVVWQAEVTRTLFVTPTTIDVTLDLDGHPQKFRLKIDPAPEQGTWRDEFERRLRVVVGAADDYLHYDAAGGGWYSEYTPNDNYYIEVQWHDDTGRTASKQFELGDLIRAVDAVAPL